MIKLSDQRNEFSHDENHPTHIDNSESMTMLTFENSIMVSKPQNINISVDDSLGQISRYGKMPFTPIAPQPHLGNHRNVSIDFNRKTTSRGSSVQRNLNPLYQSAMNPPTTAGPIHSKNQLRSPMYNHQGILNIWQHNSILAANRRQVGTAGTTMLSGDDIDDSLMTDRDQKSKL